jgi:predicted dehydrogenase
MKNFFWSLLILSLPLSAQQYKIAVIGLVHGHAWGHLPRMAKSDVVKLVGISERNPDLVAEAKKVAPDVPVYEDYNKMLDEVKPDIVWTFVENNRHLEIAKACATRKIHVMYEKPLASTYKEAVEIQKLAKKNKIKVLNNYKMDWLGANYTAKKQAN